MTTPTVSVVMPVYQREKQVGPAIQSILKQTFCDFELIIIDDGSTDNTPEVLKAAAELDSRIRVLSLPVNVGAGMARAVGHEAASGRYVAVMDSDDIALPDRLTQQVEFMETNPDVTLAGADAIKVVGEKRARMNMPTDDAEIKARLLLTDFAFVHPTVIMRRDFLLRHNLTYGSERRGDDDYEFYNRMVRAGAVLANQGVVVLEFHRHPQAVTFNNPDLEKNKWPLRQFLLQLYYPDLTGREAHALALMMQAEVKLDQQSAHAGLLAASKATACSRSYFGESKATANRILGNYQQRLQQALNKRARGHAANA